MDVNSFDDTRTAFDSEAEQLLVRPMTAVQQLPRIITFNLLQNRKKLNHEQLHISFNFTDNQKSWKFLIQSSCYSTKWQLLPKLIHYRAFNFSNVDILMLLLVIDSDDRVCARLRRWYITIPSSDQWCTTIENHRYQCYPIPKPSENHWSQWLPSTIPFNGDGNFENHWKFAMVAKECAKNPTNTTTNFKS